MATEVIMGAVALANGVAEDVSVDPRPGKDLHVGNGILENQVVDHSEKANSSVEADVYSNGDAPGPAESDQNPPVPGSTPEISDNPGILGAAPPAPPSGDIPAFGEVPLVTQPPEVSEKVPLKYDFWVVKVPRPDVSAEQNRMKMVQMTIADKKEKHNFISAALRLKQAARSEAQAALRGARDRARACSAEVRKKFDEAKPLQDMLRRLNEGRKDARAQGRGLEASTEGELNALIAAKEHRMLHESISLNEEKQLMKEIKLLEASRPKVREMEALYVAVNESLGQKDAIQAQLKPLLAEAEFLKVERDAAQEICKTFEAEAEVCEKAVQELLAERAGVVHEQDVLYDELRTLKAQAYHKEEDFRQNRRDIAQVQQLAVAKDIAELEKFCSEQRERLHAKLNKDTAYRKAYVAANQWSTIRRFGTPDTRRLGVDEDPASIMDSAAGKPTFQGADSREPRSSAPRASADAKARAEEAAKGAKAAADKKGPAAAKPAASEKASASSGGAGQSRAASAAAPAAPAPVAAAAAAPAPAVDPEEEEREKERRREEALAKAKEAEDRKRRASERAQQRAEARAAKDAEEAAKKREKEKERKARKKASEAAAKEAAAMAAAATAGDEDEGDEQGIEGTPEKARSQARKSQEAADTLTKRQRKRLAASKKGEGEEAEAQTKLKTGKQGGSAMWIYAGAGVAVIALVAFIFFLTKLSSSSGPVFEE